MDGWKGDKRYRIWPDETRWFYAYLLVLAAILCSFPIILVVFGGVTYNPLQISVSLLFGFGMISFVYLTWQMGRKPRYNFLSGKYEMNICSLLPRLEDILRSSHVDFSSTIVGPTYCHPFKPHVRLTLKDNHLIRVYPEFFFMGSISKSEAFTIFEIGPYDEVVNELAFTIWQRFDEPPIESDDATSDRFEKYAAMIDRILWSSLAPAMLSVLIAAPLIFLGFPIVSFLIFILVLGFSLSYLIYSFRRLYSKIYEDMMSVLRPTTLMNKIQ